MTILAKYGEALTFEVPVIAAGGTDFAVSADWTPATGDVKICRGGAAVADISTLPTAVTGTGAALWQFQLSATEMQAARITIQVVDSATKAVEDQAFYIQTYGNASAHHAFDLDTATQSVNTTQIEGSDATDQINAACDAALVDYDALVPADLPTNFGDLAITATTGRVDVNANNDKTGYSVSALGANVVTASALATDAAQEIRDAVTGDIVETEGSITLQQAVSVILAAVAGVSSGQTGTTPVFSTPNGNATRITGTTDGSGNRSSVSLSPSS